MRKLSCFLCAMAFVVSLGSLARAASDEGLWQTDFEAAKEKAKTEKKLLLVDFTGSDWCVWCKKLRSEVFDKDEFQTAAPKKFVLVELDFPMSKKLPDELKAQNDKLRSEYKIHGYPTVLLLDAEGKVVAHTGYKAGGPEKYVAQLDELLDVYASLVKTKGMLADAKGLDRAKLLDTLVEDDEKLNNDSDESIAWSKEIVSLDPDNKAGLKVKHEFRMLLAESKNALTERKVAEAQAAIDKALAIDGITVQQKQEGYQIKAQLCLMHKDLAGVVKALEQIVAAAPESGEAKQAQAAIAHFKTFAEAQEAVTKLQGEAEKAEGVDRAKLLDKLVDAQMKLVQVDPMGSMKQIEKWSKEIITLDPDNKEGLKTKYALRDKMQQASLALARHNFDKARSALEEAAALPGLTDDQKEKIEQARKHLPKESEKSEEK